MQSVLDMISHHKHRTISFILAIVIALSAMPLSNITNTQAESQPGIWVCSNLQEWFKSDIRISNNRVYIPLEDLSTLFGAPSTNRDDKITIQGAGYSELLYNTSNQKWYLTDKLSEVTSYREVSEVKNTVPTYLNGKIYVELINTANLLGGTIVAHDKYITIAVPTCTEWELENALNLYTERSSVISILNIDNNESIVRLFSDDIRCAITVLNAI